MTVLEIEPGASEPYETSALMLSYKNNIFDQTFYFLSGDGKKSEPDFEKNTLLPQNKLIWALIWVD